MRGIFMFFTKPNHILEQAIKELISALRETPESKELLKSQDEFDKDEHAKKLLSDFQNFQQTYSIFQQGGFPGVKDQKNKLQGLQREVQKNQKIINLITAQQNFQNNLSEFVNEISQKINFPFTPPQRSGGGC